MNKTLALIAALGLVVSAPVFAADDASDLAKTKAEATQDKADAKADAGKTVANAKAKEAKADAKADAKVAKENAKLAPSASGKEVPASTDSSKQ